jgi:hypothetical protein
MSGSITEIIPQCRCSMPATGGRDNLGTMATTKPLALRHNGAIIVGSIAGAVLRTAVADDWPAPSEQLVSLTALMFIGFLVTGAALSVGHSGTVKAFVIGACGGATSLSIYAAQCTLETARVGAAFLLAAPAVGLAGLTIGMLCGAGMRSVATIRQSR